MASNYEQPKLATSKQYNVSQGNIGQVKQQNIDWTGYESAKIWEAVAKGTGQVGQAIQVDAKLRGALDQTGNLVANNSWLTQESYDQGRASVVAEQQKGTFLEIVERTAREVAKANGTMEDYNKAIQPAYQDYIKNILKVSLRGVNGEEYDVELQKEILVNARKEMITYVALGQQKFQKIKEEQNAIDQQEINANIGNNLQYSMLMAANPADLTTLMATAYEQFRLKNSALGDPIKSRAISDGNFQVAVEAAIAQLDPMNPKDMQKIDIIKATINAPGFNLEPKVKQNIMEAAKKQTEAHNNLVNYNISGEINNLELTASMGQYKSGSEARIRSMIKSSMVSGKITPTEAAAFENQINNMLTSINKAALNSESSVLDMNPTQVSAQFTDFNKHAEKGYQAIMAKVDKEGGSVSDGRKVYAEWISTGERATNPVYSKFLISKVAEDFVKYFPDNLDQKMDDITYTTDVAEQWASLGDIAKQVPGGYNQIANVIPKEYKQAFMELANKTGGLTGDPAKDFTALQERARFIDQNKDKPLGVVTPDDLTATFTTWFGGNNQYKLKGTWFNDMSDGAKETTANIINQAFKKPGISTIMADNGVENLGSTTALINTAMEQGVIFHTGKNAVISTNISDTGANNFKKVVTLGNEKLTEKQISDYLDTTIADFKQKVGDTGWWKDRDVVATFDGASLTLKAINTDGKSQPIPGYGYSYPIAISELKAGLSKIQSQLPTPYAPLNSKGSNIKPNLAQLTAVIDNSQFMAQWGSVMYKGEGVFTNPGNPDKNSDDPTRQAITVIGQGITKHNWPKEFEMARKGYATNNMDLVNQAHTDVMVKMLKQAKPTIMKFMNNKPPEQWNDSERAAATLMMDASWLRFSDGAEYVAKALKSGKFSDLHPAIQKELHQKYDMSKPLNERGVMYATAFQNWGEALRGMIQ